ncbi:DUF1844 domain-containing protein [Candidatus Woesearchaeota archaeon]|nr:DUF1844 domain-containing protein [Candidatus Woesearchaeota archaeon]
MEQDNNNQDFEESHFLQLVYSLQSSAWFLLGKIMNPVTGKAEKDLGGAKAVIDTLLMLKNKTKGNLTLNEQKLLDNAISNLEINFAEEIEKESKEQKESKKTKEQDPKLNDTEANNEKIKEEKSKNS